MSYSSPFKASTLLALPAHYHFYASIFRYMFARIFSLLLVLFLTYLPHFRPVFTPLSKSYRLIFRLTRR